jgi:hypothetical protein
VRDEGVRGDLGVNLSAVVGTRIGGEYATSIVPRYDVSGEMIEMMGEAFKYWTVCLSSARAGDGRIVFIA